MEEEEEEEEEKEMEVGGEWRKRWGWCGEDQRAQRRQRGLEGSVVETSQHPEQRRRLLVPQEAGDPSVSLTTLPPSPLRNIHHQHRQHE
ncbi:hypothetical protein Pcinc_035560 [Petrolisthes cinctipes]|uniref:Uncharacterized protein n=1 Tax=Petrolisthes cinctipes TaxID=88211 RepID=A0AAE1BWB6_PETCI|nr:hypothetical protein Pcinc_035560 [Petrolisthes cinctipes]